MADQLELRGLETTLGYIVGDFLRQNNAAVVRCWEAGMRTFCRTQGPGWPILVTHVPRLVDQVAAMVEASCTGGLPGLPDDLAEVLACERLREGYGVSSFMHECSILRDCILQLWLERHARQQAPGMRLLNLTIDRAAGILLERYVTAKNRTLEAIESVCAALCSKGVDAGLHRLLSVIYNSCGAVDTAAILLCEGKVLRVRATVGLEAEEQLHTTIPWGEGFAGRVAASGMPLLLAADEIRATALSPILRDRGLQALYGVPLEHGGDIIGVAHVGSLRATGFSEQDKHVFAAMAHRATAGIAQHVLQERLNERSVHLENAKRVAEQIVGIVSHDLRTPIAAIALNTSMLLRKHPAEAGRSVLERILQSARRADNMITDLLDLTRARLGGGIPIRPAPTDLRRVAEEALSELRALHPDRDFVLRVTGDVHGVWDAERLGQVFCNLLHNAAKYGCERGSITIQLHGHDADVEVCVHNSGVPIAPESLPHLFKPMWRGDDSMQCPEGIGLGLFIVSSVVKAHGGSCDVASNATDGTTFRVKIPRFCRSQS